MRGFFQTKLVYRIRNRIKKLSGHMPHPLSCCIDSFEDFKKAPFSGLEGHRQLIRLEVRIVSLWVSTTYSFSSPFCITFYYTLCYLIKSGAPALFVIQLAPVKLFRRAVCDPDFFL